MDPRVFGFDIPTADPEPYASENVWTTDQRGRGCVAKVFVKVGSNFVVFLPNGRLVARKADQVDPTDREFVAASHEKIASEIMEGPLKRFTVKKTDHFVFVYNTTDAFQDVTSKVMESMLMGVGWYVREQGIPIHLPPAPLAVIMFNTEEQFQAFKPMPAGVAAYYNRLNNYVVLHEDSDLLGFSRELAQQELLSTIAHEGAHQILYNIGVQNRLSVWPMWLGEGIAEYMAPTKPGSRFKWKGAGKINDMRMFDLEVFLQGQFVNGFNGETIEGAVTASRLDGTGYAKAWCITHYLAKEKKEDFDRYMRYLATMPPMYGLDSDKDKVPVNLKHFTTFFGDDLAKLENDMINYMAKQKYTSPVAAFPHFVGTVEIPQLSGAKKHACFFHHPELVKEWQQIVTKGLSKQERGMAKWKVREYENRGRANEYIKNWLK